MTVKLGSGIEVFSVDADGLSSASSSGASSSGATVTFSYDVGMRDWNEVGGSPWSSVPDPKDYGFFPTRKTMVDEAATKELMRRMGIAGAAQAATIEEASAVGVAVGPLKRQVEQLREENRLQRVEILKLQQQNKALEEALVVLGARA